MAAGAERILSGGIGAAQALEAASVGLIFSTVLASILILYLVTCVNKPMPSLDPQTPQDGVLKNKTAGIQGFVEANCARNTLQGRLLSYSRVPVDERLGPTPTALNEPHDY